MTLYSKEEEEKKQAHMSFCVFVLLKWELVLCSMLRGCFHPPLPTITWTLSCVLTCEFTVLADGKLSWYCWRAGAIVAYFSCVLTTSPNFYHYPFLKDIEYTFLCPFVSDKGFVPIWRNMTAMLYYIEKKLLTSFMIIQHVAKCVSIQVRYVSQ